MENDVGYDECEGIILLHIYEKWKPPVRVETLRFGSDERNM
jgi:hypothetical protein